MLIGYLLSYTISFEMTPLSSASLHVIQV